MEKSPFLKQIKDNWIILSFIVALIVSWTNVNSRLVQAENDIAQLSQVVDRINTMDVRLAVIQEKVINIEKILK